MRRLPLRQSILMLIIVIALLIIALSAFVTIPMILRIRQLNVEIQDTQLFLESQYEKTLQLKRSVNELPQVITQTAPYINAFTQEDSEVELITLFEDLASRHNINQSLDITFSSDGTPPPIPQLTAQYRKPQYEVALTARGSFDDVMAYLDEIEHMPLYMIIDQVDLNANGDMINIRFSVRIFVREI